MADLNVPKLEAYLCFQWSHHKFLCLLIYPSPSALSISLPQISHSKETLLALWSQTTLSCKISLFFAVKGVNSWLHKAKLLLEEEVERFWDIVQMIWEEPRCLVYKHWIATTDLQHVVGATCLEHNADCIWDLGLVSEIHVFTTILLCMAQKHLFWAPLIMLVVNIDA